MATPTLFQTERRGMGGHIYSVRRLTGIGELVQHQITMFQGRIRTVGISLLGGNSGAPVRVPMRLSNGKGSFSCCMIDVASAVDRHIILARTYEV
ncbi:hypothetical protein EDD17DRAFT_1644951 [Pisolithus thermaeus]|nr:hypothetical protein EDD17DRAFT_1644951 [Pisolithus thermaeus]